MSYTNSAVGFCLIFLLSVNYICFVGSTPVIRSAVSNDDDGDDPPSSNDPTELCPDGIVYTKDCNECFCNSKTGLTGCTVIPSCPPTITKPVFPWQAFVPKFSVPATSTAIVGRTARDDSSVISVGDKI